MNHDFDVVTGPSTRTPPLHEEDTSLSRRRERDESAKRENEGNIRSAISP